MWAVRRSAVQTVCHMPDPIRERMKTQMEKHAAEQAVILIPSLEPDKRLPEYIQKLKDGGFAHIVVVDDGSGEAYQPIFDEVGAVEDTVVLRHEVNRGKGVALKTGYRYIMENLKDITGVITADADGQHTVADCLKLAEELSKGKRALYLGSRDFNLEVALFVGIGIRNHEGIHFVSGRFLIVHLTESHSRIRCRLAINKSKSVRSNTTRTTSHVILVIGTGNQTR